MTLDAQPPQVTPSTAILTSIICADKFGLRVPNKNKPVKTKRNRLIISSSTLQVRQDKFSYLRFLRKPILAWKRVSRKRRH